MAPTMLGEEVFSWGWAAHGQVGHGGDEKFVPTMKSMDRVLLQGQYVQYIACGFCFNLALTTRGSVYSWGVNKHQQLGHIDQKEELITPRKIKFFHQRSVVMVGAGREHALAVLSTGEVFSWGSGVYGVLGHNNEDDCTEPRMIDWFQARKPTSNEFSAPEARQTLQLSSLKVPTEKADPADSFKSDSSRNDVSIHIVSVACGHSHCLALDSKGRVYSWGLGLLGRLGHGDQKTRLRPKLISMFLDQHIKIKAISCGWDHSAALSHRTGRVFTWGCGRSHQLGGVGLRRNSPNSSLLLRRSEADGATFMTLPTKVMRWQTRNPKSNALTNMTAAPKIVRLSCGGKHNLAVAEDGAVYSWGRGEFGRLGHQDQQHRIFPLQILGFEGRIRSVSGGGYHSMAVSEEGEIYVWGCNEHGRLGVGTSQLYLTEPTMLPHTAKGAKHRFRIMEVFAGAYTSMAVGTIEDHVHARGSCALQ